MKWPCFELVKNKAQTSEKKRSELVNMGQIKEKGKHQRPAFP